MVFFIKNLHLINGFVNLFQLYIYIQIELYYIKIYLKKILVINEVFDLQ
jgi:hypothetical protein